ncbi:hypothetical protein GWK08_06530 [Leptobacterium flavescens]|uniref:Uncharacterized protein n=1 Tax=Leptobacterium flavescens TaxID=472055 RepID=A0A6P0UJD3_9FLAO|nr:hypothetical protein [Leptobacterium flavescens]NER13087.1 hypothetical protein [Leptobacterium flavescens]
MKTYLRFFALLMISVCFVSCLSDDSLDNEALESVLPEDLIGYRIVFHHTNVIFQPSGVNVASVTTYEFVNSTTVLGSGEVQLPTQDWQFINESTGGTFDAATLILNYGSLGNERYEIQFDGEESLLQERQTFQYFGTLSNNPTVRTEGHFEIQKIN